MNSFQQAQVAPVARAAAYQTRQCQSGACPYIFDRYQTKQSGVVTSLVFDYIINTGAAQADSGSFFVTNYRVQPKPPQ
jgi:hypothetical protein